jgi:hypothetical protein
MGHSFRFLDEKLNRELVDLLNKSGIVHSIDEDGVVQYSAGDGVAVENNLICSVRDKVFPSWQVLTCPSDWVARYRDYMSRHSIPFREELSDGALWFLIPCKHRPHSWKLSGIKKGQRLAKSER